MRALGLSAKKSLGQNFILDLNLTRRIARAAGPLEGRTVVEVGPGPGGLTRALFLEGAERVVAVERDARCRPALEAIAERYPGRLDVHYGDALEADWRALGRCSGPKPVIAANLPYNVATLLLIGWLESEPWPPWYERMALMFQKEVAERIVAAPGTKAYGRLAVIAQWRTQAAPALHGQPGGLHAAADGDLRRRRVRADRAAVAGVLGQDAGRRHGRRLRPAPQDAAPEPEVAAARARGAARRRRHRPDAARRGAQRARVRPAGLCARAVADGPLSPLRGEGRGEGRTQLASTPLAAPHANHA